VKRILPSVSTGFGSSVTEKLARLWVMVIVSCMGRGYSFGFCVVTKTLGYFASLFYIFLLSSFSYLSSIPQISEESPLFYIFLLSSFSYLSSIPQISEESHFIFTDMILYQWYYPFPSSSCKLPYDFIFLLIILYIFTHFHTRKFTSVFFLFYTSQKCYGNMIIDYRIFIIYNPLSVPYIR